MNIETYCRLLLCRPRGLATERSESVFAIDYDRLARAGVRLVLFDVDDTLTGTHDRIGDDGRSLLQRLRERMATAIVTNCTPVRRRALVAELGDLVAAVNASADKPHPRAFNDILHRLGIAPAQAAVVGDRPGTDLYGALLAGIPVRILVRPYSDAIGGHRAGWPYRLIRALETRFLS